MISARNVIKNDLDYICTNSSEELARLSGKNLLITGGAGFLGYYLTLSAIYWNKKNNDKNPIKVFIMDNFIRGIPNWIKGIENDPLVDIQSHDITNPLPLDAGPFTYIIHAASIASPTYYRLHPIETMDANIYGLRHLLDLAKERKASKQPIEGFLFFSSSEIYGNPSPDNIPTPETYYGYVSCTGPRACYDESKRYGETLCVNFAQQHEIPVTIARPFNNYGPGLKITDKRAIADFARNIFEGTDIILHSDGSATRTFCYIADAIIGYFKVLVNGKAGESYNIGTDNPEISIIEFANAVCGIGKELFEFQGKLVFQPSDDKDYLSDNPQRRCPDITKAKNELGYNPTISLEEGIKRSLIWYSDNKIDAEG